MRRLLATVILGGAAAALVFLALGAGSDSGKQPRYWVELDNAFGLIEGGDLKIAGVRAGKITDMKLDRRTHRARVGFEVTQTGFGSLRRDVRCESRPQSLIGEYFLDCQPGTAKEELKPGAVIPVSQSASTVAPDLVNNIMRRPYRERLALIIAELGAGVGGNAQALNDAIRRASPGLRETDKVLAILARQNTVLRDLVTNADRVVGDLADNKKDVGRWVVEARDTATASAARRSQISEGFRRLPGFLRELKPTMAALGDVAREQSPALRNLDASAQRLERLLGDIGPFADASRPAFKALGRASDAGRKAMRSTQSTIDELAKFSGGVPELGRNLAITLEHLDDRQWAVEKDPRSPGGQGYTGLEALLTYVYDQTLSINTFDSNTHYLKVAVAESECAHYADVKRLRDHPELEDQCGARIGPKAPGINYRDPTAKPGDDQARATRHKTDRTSESRPPDQPAAPTAPAVPGAPEAPAAPSTPAAPNVAPSAPSAPPATTTTPSGPPVQLPSVPPVNVGATKDDRPPSADTQQRLLDYLMAP
jgi:virulence factor Mce-like protein